MVAKFREIFESTPVSGIKNEPHIWRDLELDSLPTGRIVLVGDAAHTMTPFRGEGGYHAFIDTIKLSKILSQLDVVDIEAVKSTVAKYNVEMLERGLEALRDARKKQPVNKNKDQKSKSVLAMQEPKPLLEEEIVLDVNH